MAVQAGQTVSGRFCLSNPSTGAASNADSTPTGVLLADSVATAASVVISAGSNTGEYNFTFTIPAGQAIASGMDLEVVATVAGVTARAVIWSDRVDATVNSRLSSLGATAPAGWINAAAIAASALNGKGDWLTGLGANAPAGWINAAAIAAAALDGKGNWSTFDPATDGVFVTALDGLPGLAAIDQAYTTNGFIEADLTSILGYSLAGAGVHGDWMAAAFTKFFNVTVPNLTTASISQSGDSYARLGAPASVSVSADIAVVAAKTGNLPDDPASETNATNNKNAILTHGDANWEGGGGSSSGTGAFTVIVPVTDGVNPLQNVTVALTLNAITYRATTDVNGHAVFNLDAGTYALAATYPGYTYGGGTVVVAASGNTDVVAMTMVVIPQPSKPGDCTVSFLLLNQDDTPAAGVSLLFYLKAPPTGSGVAYLSNGHPPRKAIAAGDGTVTIELPQASAWNCEPPGGTPNPITIPSATTFNPPNMRL